MKIARRRLFTLLAGLGGVIATSPALAIGIPTDFERAVTLIWRNVYRLSQGGNDGETENLDDLLMCCKQIANPGTPVPGLQNITLHSYDRVLRSSADLSAMGFDDRVIQKAYAHVAALGSRPGEFSTWRY